MEKLGIGWRIPRPVLVTPKGQAQEGNLAGSKYPFSAHPRKLSPVEKELLRRQSDKKEKKKKMTETADKKKNKENSEKSKMKKILKRTHSMNMIAELKSKLEINMDGDNDHESI